MGLVLLPVVVLVVLAVILYQRIMDPVRRARYLRRSGFGFMALFAVFFGLFVVGETVSDPGGWKAVGLIAAWGIPLAALAAFGWYRPGPATRLFAALTAAVIGLGIWFAASPEAWRGFENRNGPVRDIVTFVLAAAIALLGLKRTAAAGAMLIVLGVVPVTISTFGHDRLVTLAVVSAPPLVSGVFYLLSGTAAERPAPPRTGETTPQDRAKAA